MARLRWLGGALVVALTMAVAPRAGAVVREVTGSAPALPRIVPRPDTFFHLAEQGGNIDSQLAPTRLPDPCR